MTATSDTKERIDFGTNYGDVALDLPPDWSRSRLAGDPGFMLTAVGHENGVPDAYMTDQPKQRHQFKWLNPKDQAEKATHRTRHYETVTNTRWTKNENLWDWDAEGHVVYNGLILYARDEVYYVDEKETQDRLKKERDEKKNTEEEERLIAKLLKRGATMEDERGRPLLPLSNKR